MKKKKLTAVLLAMAIFAVSLAGCGGKTEDTGGNSENSGTENTDNGSGETAAEGFHETGLPIVDPGSYTFSLFVDGSLETDEPYAIPVFEEQTGIKVELQMFPFEIAKEKFSLALSSGDYADCIGGWCLKDTDILTYGVDMGVFIPLEDYFEKYCPNIMKILEIEGVRETMTAPDGHIYSIPYVLETPEVDFNPFINIKWLENLGLEMPETTEEFREVLIAFRDKDANGNGNPNDEIPYSFSPENRHLGYLAGYFGISVDNYGFTVNENGDLIFGANTEEYKNGMKWLASLYKEGLLDSEMFTQDTAQWKAKGEQDLYGVCMAYASGDYDPFLPGTEPDWRPLPVLKSENVDKPVWLRNTTGVNTLKNQVVITDNAKNPAAICRWWDNAFELDNYVRTQKGEIGVTCEREGDSFRVYDVNTLSEDDQIKYNWSNLWPQSLPKYVPIGFRFIDDNPPYEEKKKVTPVYEEFLTEHVVPPYWVTLDDAPKMSEYQTTITDYINQKNAEWITGQTDIDADWDAYLKQLDKLDLNGYIKMRQDAINK